MLQRTAKVRSISRKSRQVTVLALTALQLAYTALAASQRLGIMTTYSVSSSPGSHGRARAGYHPYGGDVNDPTYPGPGVRPYGWLRNFQIYLAKSKLPKSLSENEYIDHASDVGDGFSTILLSPRLHP